MIYVVHMIHCTHVDGRMGDVSVRLNLTLMYICTYSQCIFIHKLMKKQPKNLMHLEICICDLCIYSPAFKKETAFALKFKCICVFIH